MQKLKTDLKKSLDQILKIFNTDLINALKKGCVFA